MFWHFQSSSGVQGDGLWQKTKNKNSAHPNDKESQSTAGLRTFCSFPLRQPHISLEAFRSSGRVLRKHRYQFEAERPAHLRRLHRWPALTTRTFSKPRNNKSAPASSRQSEADGYAQTNLLACKIPLFATAFFILIPASTWAGLIAANFLFGYLWFWWIQ